MIRATFEKRFTVRRMAADYVRHYKALLQDETRRALPPVRMLSAVCPAKRQSLMADVTTHVKVPQRGG